MTKNSRSNSGEQEKEPKKQGKFNENYKRLWNRSSKAKDKRNKLKSFRQRKLFLFNLI
jgi:hypothetical protein